MLFFYLFMVVGFGLLAYLLYYIFQDDKARARQHLADETQYAQHHYSDDLSKSILALLDDIYMPFFPVNLSDHLVSDLDIDSLDFVDLLYDIEQICGVKLNASEFHQQYGRNPTVAQLISYVRHAVDSKSTPAPSSPTTTV